MIRHITLPAGFVAGATACGIKKSGRKDVAIIAGENEVAAAIVTTSNQIFGAPIAYDRDIMPGGCGVIRGIVINAGCSNVCTGKAGYKDAATMAKLTAKRLGTTPEKVLVASTGVIGHRLPMEKVKTGINSAADLLGTKCDDDVVEAISTTDLARKSALLETRIDGKKITVGGVVKGSGMIAPSMATMIGVITTDAKVSPTVLRKILREATRVTFNAVTVDSDQSTSDIVAIMASGKVDMKSVKLNTPQYAKLLAAVCKVCHSLAFAIAADGEGATRVIEISVTGARNDKDAEIAAKSVANSPLVKTAVHGADPNWGRIAMALGKSEAKVDGDKLVIKLTGTRIFAKGKGCRYDEKAVSKRMKQPVVKIDCSLGMGNGNFTALTCDLSREYITINADYTT